MKKLFLSMVMLLSTVVTFSQTNLSPDEFAKLPIDVQNQINSVKKSTETDAQIETVGKWVGLGKEVGYAFDGALTAITTTATKFSETKLGKITMFLVIYKVIGTDILQIMFGVLWIILVISATLFIHINYGKDKRILIKETYNSESKKYDRVWEIRNGENEYRVGSVWVLIIGICISMPIFLSI
jgi:hypothetical protein